MDKCFNIHNRNDEKESPEERQAREEASKEICRAVEKHVKRIGGEQMERVRGMTMSGMFGKENVVLAIKKVRKGTVPGRDGFPTEFYSEDEEVLNKMGDHLSKLFMEIANDKDMTQAMKCAIVSILYKGKGKDKATPESYRPISITPAEYRIMTKAIQI